MYEPALPNSGARAQNRASMFSGPMLHTYIAMDKILCTFKIYLYYIGRTNSLVHWIIYVPKMFVRLCVMCSKEQMLCFILNVRYGFVLNRI